MGMMKNDEKSEKYVDTNITNTILVLVTDTDSSRDLVKVRVNKETLGGC